MQAVINPVTSAAIGIDCRVGRVRLHQQHHDTKVLYLTAFMDKLFVAFCAALGSVAGRPTRATVARPAGGPRPTS